jgi:hypothetical protein
MKKKLYVRYIDFVILLVLLDILHLLSTMMLWVLLGPDKEDPMLITLAPLLSAVLFWMKLGLALLFWKRVPFRTEAVDASLEIKKIWTMALFWPLLFLK